LAHQNVREIVNNHNHETLLRPKNVSFKPGNSWFSGVKDCLSYSLSKSRRRIKVIEKKPLPLNADLRNRTKKKRLSCSCSDGDLMKEQQHVAALND
jgi:site-specific DNA-cytosine methylase